MSSHVYIKKINKAYLEDSLKAHSVDKIIYSGIFFSVIAEICFQKFIKQTGNCLRNFPLIFWPKNINQNKRYLNF